jgi:hypothetical protein
MSNAIARPRWWDAFFWGRFWCGLALIGLGVPAFYQLGAQHRMQLAVDQARDQLFKRGGVAADARVTGKSEVPYGKGAQGWWVSYNYQDAHGESHFGLGTISKEAWERLRGGRPTAYRVSRRRPRKEPAGGRGALPRSVDPCRAPAARDGRLRGDRPPTDRLSHPEGGRAAPLPELWRYGEGADFLGE